MERFYVTYCTRSADAQAIYFVADRPAGSDICMWGLQTAHRLFILSQHSSLC